MPDEFDDRDDFARPRRRPLPPSSGGSGGMKIVIFVVLGVVVLLGAVVGLLILLLLPAVQKVRDAAARAKTMNNMKQIALALDNYHSTYNSYPPVAMPTRDGKPGLSWRVAILPFVENNYLYQQFKLDEAWDSPNNLPLLNDVVEVYRSLDDPPGTTATHYRVFVGNGAAFSHEKQTRLFDLTDGTSNTILVAETTDAVPWTKPDEIDYNPNGPLPAFGLAGKDYVMVAMADGFVKAISKKCSAASWHAAINGSDGKNPGADFDR